VRLLFWETTVGCNLACIHCRRLEVARTLMKDDLSFEESCRFLDSLAECKPDQGPTILVLSGGEPLFRPDIFELAGHARSRGLMVSLATNGTLIDDAMADRIVTAGIARVAISIDGADGTTHDQFRRQPGALKAALDGFRRLRARGMSMQINCTITRHNRHQVDDLYRMAIDLGADALHIFMLVPVGCGVTIAASNMLPAEEYEEVLGWMYDRTLEGKLQLKATCAPHYFRIAAQRRKAAGQSGMPGAAGPGHHPGHSPLAANTKGCLAGQSICFVSHKGDVFPCGYLPVSAGNVRQQTFREVWEKSPVFARLRDDEQLGGKCGVCEFRRICMGCRARAFHEHDDFMAEEPYCVYTPAKLRV
jgi:radical SAM protein with 4Fe4S-binding SPASM domain